MQVMRWSGKLRCDEGQNWVIEGQERVAGSAMTGETERDRRDIVVWMDPCFPESSMTS